MGTMIWQRRRRLARMKVQGYPARRVVAGAALRERAAARRRLLDRRGLWHLRPAADQPRAASVTGFPVVFSAGALVAIVSFALVTAVAVAIVAMPGYRAARVAPYV